MSRQPLLRTVRSPWLALLLALAATACGGSSPATQLVVEVHTNFVIPDQLNGLRLTVRAGDQMVFQKTFALGRGAGEVMLPARTNLVPSGGGNATFTITADGLFNGAEVVSRRVSSTFLRGQSRLLRIDLLQACRATTCPAGQTCVGGGGCVADAIDPSALPVFDPKQAPPPAGDGGAPAGDGPASPDGSALDGSRDGALDAPVAPTDGPGSDAVPSDGAPRPNGAACAFASECSSGACADGVCCDRACTGECQACNVEGRVGTCSPVPEGTDPANECAEEGAATCGRDGFCDGSGACRKYPSGTVCKAGSCSEATRTLAFTCDGRGACQPGPSQSCEPYTCAPTGGCLTTCAGDADCISPSRCVNGSCGKKPTGQACAAASECQSNFCQQGVCCATECTGTCRSCALMGSEGSCQVVPDGDDPADHCKAEAPSTCGQDGSCDGTGHCRQHKAGTTCSSPSCTGDVAATAGACNGKGTCLPGQTTACRPYVCGANACKTSCLVNTDCVAGFQCTGGVCVTAQAEDCTNGVDDDGDGAADCADKDCGAFVCVAPPPQPWVGPVSFYQGSPSSAPPGCSGSYPGEVFSGYGGKLSCATAVCGACGCDNPTGSSCTVAAINWHGKPLLNGNCGTVLSTTKASGVCAALTTQYMTIEGPSLGKVGTCAATGGAATVEKAQWDVVGRACRGAGFGAGCGGGLCAPAPGAGFESKLCVFAEGDGLECPQGYQGSKRVFYNGHEDTRGCGACACGTPTGETCRGRLYVHSNGTCIDRPGVLDLPAKGCLDAGSFSYYSYTGYAPSGGSCQPTAANPAPTGSCTPVKPVTICCMP